MRQLPSKTKGITLLEALIYIVIVGTVLYYVGGFAINSLFSKQKIGAVHDVSGNAQYMVDEIADKIKESVEVNGITP